MSIPERAVKLSIVLSKNQRRILSNALSLFESTLTSTDLLFSPELMTALQN